MNQWGKYGRTKTNLQCLFFKLNTLICLGILAVQGLFSTIAETRYALIDPQSESQISFRPARDCAIYHILSLRLLYHRCLRSRDLHSDFGYPLRSEERRVGK